MRTILMLVVAIAAGCTDEPMDPHELTTDCDATLGVAECEIACASGWSDPPLVVDGKTCPPNVVEYDGQLGACWGDSVDGKPRVIFAPWPHC